MPMSSKVRKIAPRADLLLSIVNSSHLGGPVAGWFFSGWIEQYMTGDRYIVLCNCLQTPTKAFNPESHIPDFDSLIPRDAAFLMVRNVQELSGRRYRHQLTLFVGQCEHCRRVYWSISKRVSRLGATFPIGSSKATRL